jgi:hypothetical protein
MPYALSDFCAAITRTIKAKGEAGLPELADKLSDLLNNPAFVAEAFAGDNPPPKRELWHDPETDVYVLAHVQNRGPRRQAAQSRQVVGDLRHRAWLHRHDRMAAGQSGKRRQR